MTTAGADTMALLMDTGKNGGMDGCGSGGGVPLRYVICYSDVKRTRPESKLN